MKLTGTKKREKSNIFGSKSERKRFKTLESFYANRGFFTYPEPRVAGFVKHKNIEHLLSQNKWRYYYLNCSVDCIVCDDEGDVYCAYEFWGWSHQDPGVKEQDEFKKQIIPYSGIPLIIINYQEEIKLSDIPLEQELDLLNPQAYEWWELQQILLKFRENLGTHLENLLKKK